MSKTNKYTLIAAETVSKAYQIVNNVQKIQFRHDEIVIYWQYVGDRRTPLNLFNSTDEKANQSYTNNFSQSAQKNLKKAIDILLQITPPIKRFHPLTKKPFNHRLSVITLTIPTTQVIHPNTAYNQLLKPFIDYLRKTKDVENYIWKLEFQKRGQIHYHITMPQVIHWREIRNKWNYLLKKNNYLNEYYSKKGNYDPNSTDIHKVYNIDKIGPYLMKEFVKSCQNVDINKHNYTKEDINKKFKYWDCSNSLVQCKRFATDMNEDIAYSLYNYISKTDKEVQYLKLENCEIIKLDDFKLNEILPLHLKEQYYKHIKPYLQKGNNYELELN